MSDLARLVVGRDPRCCIVCGLSVEDAETGCPLLDSYRPGDVDDKDCLDSIVYRERRDRWQDGGAA